MISINNFDVLVVGAGQAGLAMSYQLAKANVNHLVIDAHNRIGDSWRNRYDSLVLFTPRFYSSLPGLSLEGNQEAYPTKDEIADYLMKYAEKHSLPVQMKTKVISVENISHKKKITTNKGVYMANSVVIATGPFQTPYIPEFASKLNKEICQVHSAYYTNPSILQEGTTLVVGAGNSGLQIAVEIAEMAQVYVSVGKKQKIIPKKIMGKSLFWWFEKLKISEVTAESKFGKIIKQNDPIIGTESKRFVKDGHITLLPRLVNADGPIVYFDDQSQLRVDNVIWSTGYRFDYSWIKIKDIMDETGKPIHKRGVSPQRGLYFLGLPWQHKRGSALILGVADDAQYLVEEIINQTNMYRKDPIANV